MRDGTLTKERIERAALKLFVQNGVAETSIKEIAKEAKVSQGAMYNHYHSKEELAWELFAGGFSEIGLELRRLAKTQSTLQMKLRAMISYVFERFDKDWLSVSYVFMARHLHLRRVTPRMGNPYLAFRAVIANAMGHGEIPRRDPELAASLVVGAIIQVIDTKIFGRLKGNLSDRALITADSCTNLLLAPEENSGS